MQAASPLRMSNLAGRAPKAKRSASTPAVDVSEPSASGSKPSISTSEPVGTSAGRSSYWALCPHYIWPNPTRRTVNKDQFA
ncbi:hypothetical protein PI124_g21723 [Phytophthora idaei]|nr:hypothetical protein PI125_g16328 [Phytophthora idaei]KAG3128012.1 hypothetical protein PI126_g21595 [Phytophthora idaei]KAG3233200.1 hypothetical protein PI124_g21723 [Phytophthora idaei]